MCGARRIVEHVPCDPFFGWSKDRFYSWRSVGSCSGRYFNQRIPTWSEPKIEFLARSRHDRPSYADLYKGGVGGGNPAKRSNLAAFLGPDPPKGGVSGGGLRDPKVCMKRDLF